MTRVHDLGGRRGFGPVSLGSEDDPPFSETWHARVFALVRVLIAGQAMAHDEFRFARERMDPQAYLGASYYERLLHAMQTVLVEQGVLEVGALAGALAAVAANAADDAHGAPVDVPGTLEATPAMRTAALEQALEQAGVVTARELDDWIDDVVSRRNPAAGATVVARAWSDPDVRQALLADGNAGLEAMGFGWAFGLHAARRFVVVENAAEVHNVIVCTLCSCYPTALLGPPPGWYKSDAYRARVVLEPRAVLRELGLELPADVRVRVWDSTAQTRYMVLPTRPEGTEDLGVEELAALVPRDALVGTAVARRP